MASFVGTRSFAATSSYITNDCDCCDDISVALFGSVLNARWNNGGGESNRLWLQEQAYPGDTSIMTLERLPNLENLKTTLV